VPPGRLLVYVIDPLEGRHVREYQKDPENRNQPSREKPEHKQDDTFSPFDQSHMALQPQTLGPGASIARGESPHEATETDQGCVADISPDAVSRCADKEEPVGITVQHRIQKSPEDTGPLRVPGEYTVQNIEQPPRYDENTAGPWMEGDNPSGHSGNGKADQGGLVRRKRNPSYQRGKRFVEKMPKAAADQLGVPDE